MAVDWLGAKRPRGGLVPKGGEHQGHGKKNRRREVPGTELRVEN